MCNIDDLSQGEPDAAGRPFPYTWDACSWTELGGVALHSFYDNSSIDVAGYSPYASPSPSWQPLHLSQACPLHQDGT